VLCFVLGRAIAQAVSRWLPTAAARVHVRADHVGFVVDKAALGQVLSKYLDFPCQSSFHQFFSIIIITRGWHNRPIGGSSAEWTQSESTPHYTNNKLFCIIDLNINVTTFSNTLSSTFFTEQVDIKEWL
jgi:hypothetical protein